MSTRTEYEYIIETLRKLHDEGESIRSTAENVGYSNDPVYEINGRLFDAWQGKILTFLKERNIVAPDILRGIESENGQFVESIDGIQYHLMALIDAIKEGYIISNDSNTALDVEDKILLVLNRFNKVARQLQNRHENRNTITIEDEYDVQDLLHSLLVLFFDDIRPEEWTPSYAGGAVRADFLLRKENIIIEVKKTRKSLTSKRIGEELIIDREKYKKHPNCKRLICFVYDPEGRIGNPEGLKNDLERDQDGFVSVYIRPQ